eukprot:6178838-Pleurochrysis_carterae.AAC.1
MVLGGSDGLLPASTRACFRIEELLLASESRARLFLWGQCCPFVLSKARHFVVTWTGSWAIVQTLFYHVFTSHVEVALTHACDTCVMVRRPPPAASTQSPSLCPISFFLSLSISFSCYRSLLRARPRAHPPLLS